MRYKYFMTGNIETAVSGALEWFITHGCRWAGLKGRMPTRESITETYKQMLQDIEKRQVAWCETGNLRVAFGKNSILYGFPRENPSQRNHVA